MTVALKAGSTVGNWVATTAELLAVRKADYSAGWTAARTVVWTVERMGVHWAEH
jgi:hypothetical protein